MKRVASPFRWDNRFLRQFPGDASGAPHAARQVLGALWADAEPTPAGVPRLLALSSAAAHELRTPPAALRSESAVRALGGAALFEGSEPAAHRYGGFQFGSWAGQLGDGRAVSLGEVAVAAAGAGGDEGGSTSSSSSSSSSRPATTTTWELQLKGAGPTCFSRGFDGRAALRSSLREYVASEAMGALGVPTTRALSLVALDGCSVPRPPPGGGAGGGAGLGASPMLVDEPAAVLCRMAPSFLRFGSLELCAALGEHELLRQLVGDVAAQHYGIAGGGGGGGGGSGGEGWDATVLALYRGVVERSAALVAQWQALGFVHGVLNTDNLSLLGLTIDYGPFAFMEHFRAGFVGNSSDRQRRYAFQGQPDAVTWGLNRLGTALSQAMDGGKEGVGAALGAELQRFPAAYEAAFGGRMRRKLGLRAELAGDGELVDSLLRTMQQTGADWTNTFRALCAAEAAGRRGARHSCAAVVDAVVAHTADSGGAEGAVQRRVAWEQWVAHYSLRLGEEEDDPSTPGGGGGNSDAARQAEQRRENPRYVPRNHLLHRAILEAEAGDCAELHTLCDVLAAPFDEQPQHVERYAFPDPVLSRMPGVAVLS